MQVTAPKGVQDPTNACDPCTPKTTDEAALKRWLEANREAVDFWNADLERNGLPLDPYSQF